MLRLILKLAMLVALAIVAFALWMVWSGRAGRPAQTTLNDTIHSAITNTQEFARTHFTGGVGAVMLLDPATGTPTVQNVLAGSPAEKAGLQANDHIVQVDGVSTSGKQLAQVVESIRGSSFGSVTLTIQRAGTNNFQCVIHRASWNNLGVKQ